MLIRKTFSILASAALLLGSSQLPGGVALAQDGRMLRMQRLNIASIGATSAPIGLQAPAFAASMTIAPLKTSRLERLTSRFKALPLARGLSRAQTQLRRQGEGLGSHIAVLSRLFRERPGARELPIANPQTAIPAANLRGGKPAQLAIAQPVMLGGAAAILHLAAVPSPSHAAAIQNAAAAPAASPWGIFFPGSELLLATEITAVIIGMSLVVANKDSIDREVRAYSKGTSTSPFWRVASGTVGGALFSMVASSALLLASAGLAAASGHPFAAATLGTALTASALAGGFFSGVMFYSTLKPLTHEIERDYVAKRTGIARFLPSAMRDMASLKVAGHAFLRSLQNAIAIASDNKAMDSAAAGSEHIGMVLGHGATRVSSLVLAWPAGFALGSELFSSSIAASLLALLAGLALGSILDIPGHWLGITLGRIAGLRIARIIRG